MFIDWRTDKQFNIQHVGFIMKGWRNNFVSLFF